MKADVVQKWQWHKSKLNCSKSTVRSVRSNSWVISSSHSAWAEFYNMADKLSFHLIRAPLLLECFNSVRPVDAAKLLECCFQQSWYCFVHLPLWYQWGTECSKLAITRNDNAQLESMWGMQHTMHGWQKLPIQSLQNIRYWSGETRVLVGFCCVCAQDAWVCFNSWYNHVNYVV